MVIEAMSMGTPVVCLDNGGPGLHVTEECGFKITPRTPRETVVDLADALDRLYSDEDLRRRMGAEGHIRAETLYNWDRLGDRLRDIYGQAINGESSNSTR